MFSVFCRIRPPLPSESQAPLANFVLTQDWFQLSTNSTKSETSIMVLIPVRCKASLSFEAHIKEINTIMHNFLWNGKDKIKRLTVIGDYKDGGLKMPHLTSLIDTQRILFIRKYLESSPEYWKYILNSYLRDVGENFSFKM